MRRICFAALAAALLTAGGTGAAQAGCYRWGGSGYHWYRFCVGPAFLYPHHRHCRGPSGNRYCWEN